MKHRIKMCPQRPFRAGDVVDHAPSGARWVLACDEEDGVVFPLGWPEVGVQASDCTISSRATDDMRMSVLQEVAKLRDQEQWYLRTSAPFRTVTLHAVPSVGDVICIAWTVIPDLPLGEALDALDACYCERNRDRGSAGEP